MWSVESERHRLAGLLQERLISQLRLLLSQVDVFERTLPPHLAARGSSSVVVALARQLLQQANDLAGDLRPTVLETEGLPQALEVLANQAMRVRGVQITVVTERMPDWLPQPIELVLFRSAQEAVKLGRYIP